MEAIGLLKKDHRAVEALFKRYEQAGDGARKLKGKLVEQIISELSKHAAIEEQYLYPAARRVFSEKTTGTVLEALEEHHVVKWLLNELLNMSPEAERFDAKVHVLMENVRRHIKEEEKILFVHLRKSMRPADLKTLGARLERAKAIAPTRPHPMGPDTPPGNRLVAPVESAVDAGRDLLRSLATRNRTRRGISTSRTVH